MSVNFNLGEVIMKCKPLVHILNENQKSNRCDFCFKLSDGLLKCSGCKSMYYCNKKCQKLDWIECHRNECKIYLKFRDNLGKDCDRFLLRLLLINTFTKRDSETHQLYNGVKRCFNDLMTHSEDISEDTKRMQYFNDVSNRFISFDLSFDSKLLFELFCKICINSFSILNEDLNEIGSALYICGSVLNHSCQPNAATIFNGIDLEIRAIKQINSNEEICINYIDIKTDKNERIEKLKRQYYFHCNCHKCCSLCDKHINYSLVRDLDKQMDELITSQSNWQKCYSLGMESIPLYKQIYEDFHPDLTVQLMRVLKVKLLITNNLEEKESFKLIKMTQNSIKITHGFKHKLFDIFKNTIGL